MRDGVAGKGLGCILHPHTGSPKVRILCNRSIKTYRESDNIPLNIWLLFQCTIKFFVMIGKQCFYSSMQKIKTNLPLS